MVAFHHAYGYPYTYMETLLDEIKKQIKGEIDTSEATREVFSHDASLFEVVPQAVLTPNGSADIQAIVKAVASAKQAGHDVAGAGGVGEAGAERHVAAAFAVDGPGCGESGEAGAEAAPVAKPVQAPAAPASSPSSPRPPRGNAGPKSSDAPTEGGSARPRETPRPARKKTAEAKTEPPKPKKKIFLE